MKPDRAGSRSKVKVEDGRLVIEPTKRAHYTLSELLSRCHRSELPPRRSDRAWLHAPTTGAEEL